MMGEEVVVKKSNWKIYLPLLFIISSIISNYGPYGLSTEGMGNAVCGAGIGFVLGMIIDTSREKKEREKLKTERSDEESVQLVKLKDGKVYRVTKVEKANEFVEVDGKLYKRVDDE
jgi:hypothetical protein